MTRGTSQNRIPQNFSRGSQKCTSHTFPRLTKHVYTSLACSQDFENLLRVEICSVMLRQQRKPHWVYPAWVQSFSWHHGMHPSWETKQRDDGVVGSFTTLSLFVYMEMFNLPIFRCPSKTPCHLTYNHPAF